MKKLKCNFCNEEWYIEESVLNKINVCPFCTSQIWEKNEIKVFDSLDKAIYGAINSKGLDIFQSLPKLSGYLLDIAPELKKEIRIFSKTMNEEYVIYLKEAFEKDEIGVESIINKLRYLFIEDEGLSEKWADMLCESLQGAIMYTKGIGMSSITADVTDIQFMENCHEQSNRQETEIEDIDLELYRKQKKLMKADIETLRSLAFSYKDGKCKDEEKAADYFELLARMGDEESQYNLAVCYMTGKGRNQNDELAASWCFKILQSIEVNSTGHEYYKKSSMNVLRRCMARMPVTEQRKWEAKIKKLNF